MVVEGGVVVCVCVCVCVCVETGRELEMLGVGEELGAERVRKWSLVRVRERRGEDREKRVGGRGRSGYVCVCQRERERWCDLMELWERERGGVNGRCMNICE